MKKIVRSIYVRGLGIHGQFCTKEYVPYSRTFLKLDLFNNCIIDKISANYFGTGCSTTEGELLYWGWNFNPYTCFSLLEWYEALPMYAHIVHFKRKWSKQPSILYNLGEYNEGIARICLGNAYVLSLTNKGELLGAGTNDAVYLLIYVGAIWECRKSV